MGETDQVVEPATDKNTAPTLGGLERYDPKAAEALRANPMAVALFEAGVEAAANIGTRRNISELFPTEAARIGQLDGQINLATRILGGFFPAGPGLEDRFRKYIDKEAENRMAEAPKA